MGGRPLENESFNETLRVVLQRMGKEGGEKGCRDTHKKVVTEWRR